MWALTVVLDYFAFLLTPLHSHPWLHSDGLHSLKKCKISCWGYSTDWLSQQCPRRCKFKAFPTDRVKKTSLQIPTLCLSYITAIKRDTTFRHRLDSGKSHLCFGVSQWTWIMHMSHIWVLTLREEPGPSKEVLLARHDKLIVIDKWAFRLRRVSNEFQSKAVMESRETEMLCGTEKGYKWLKSI